MSIYDERQVKGYNPGSGQQQPGKYPYVGPAYQKYGEQPGWTYSPRDDKYYRDQATREGLDEYEQQQGLKEKAPKQPGLLDTVAPVAGTLGAIYLGKTLGTEAIPFIKDTLSSTASSAAPAATQGSQGLLSAADSGVSTAANTGASFSSSGATGVQTLADGSTLMSDGSVLPAGAEGTLGSTLGTVVGVAGAAKGAYDVGKGWDKGGEGVRSGLTTMGASLGGLGAGPLGAAAGAAVGNIVGYGFQGDEIKNDLALAALGPPGWSLLAAKKLGLKHHVSTRQQAASRSQGLLGASDDANYQSYVKGMREQYQSAPTDPTKPFAGKYASWDDYVKGGLEASNLTGVYGNIKSYGPRWANLTEEQRQAVTQENINSGLYYSDKGDVLINDEAKALENLNKVAPETPQIKGAAPTTGTVFDGRPVTKIERSSTRSPGIGLDGKPIRNPGLLGAR